MIKRTYFIYTTYNDGRNKIHSWRQTWKKSWRPQHVLVMQGCLDNIAEEVGCSPDDLIIMAFSRL